MAVKIWEDFESRDTTGSSQTRIYNISGTSSETTAFATLLAEAPLLLASGLVRQAKNASVEIIGIDLWKGKVTYGEAEDSKSQERLETGEYVISFDTSGGTQKITASETDPDSYAFDPFFEATVQNANIAPDFGTAINVNDGKVEGVEIVIPALKFSVRKRQPRAIITMPFIKDLARMTGRTNDGPYLTFDAGELLFTGASGQEGLKFDSSGEIVDLSGDPEITYNFVASENLTNFKIGNIEVQQKDGHQFLWVLFEEGEDAEAHKLVQRPQAVYVHDIYKPDAFSLLGIE